MICFELKGIYIFIFILFILANIAGKNVAELREATGVKAGVSKVVQGIHDRVLTINGTLEGVAKVSNFLKRKTRMNES